MPRGPSRTGSAAVRARRPARVVRRDEAAHHRPRAARRAHRRPWLPRPRARAARAATAPGSGRQPPPRGLVDEPRQCRTRRSPHRPTGRRSDAGGLPRTVSATSRGEPLSASATSRARPRPAPRARCRKSAADRCAARERRDRPGRAATRRRNRMTAAGAISRRRPTSRNPSSPCHSPPPARSATMTTSAPPAVDEIGRTRQLRREALDGRGLHHVERLALGHASAIVDKTNRGGRVTPREHVSEGAAKLARADDGDVAHQWAIVRDNDRWRFATASQPLAPPRPRAIQASLGNSVALGAPDLPIAPEGTTCLIR